MSTKQFLWSSFTYLVLGCCILLTTFLALAAIVQLSFTYEDQPIKPPTKIIIVR